jgi:hypothetical protein
MYVRNGLFIGVCHQSFFSYSVTISKGADWCLLPVMYARDGLFIGVCHQSFFSLECYGVPFRWYFSFFDAMVFSYCHSILQTCFVDRVIFLGVSLLVIFGILEVILQNKIVFIWWLIPTALENSYIYLHTPHKFKWYFHTGLLFYFKIENKPTVLQTWVNICE